MECTFEINNAEIEGFATDMSVNAGARVDFKINVNGGAGSDYIVEIFRLGYYGGSGAGKICPVDEHQRHGPAGCARRRLDAPLVDAGNWSVTDGWNMPGRAVSGVYLARLQRLYDSNGDPIDGAVNQIPFVVRNDGGESHDIVLQTSDTTWQAYNAWGGNNGVVGANLYGDKNDSINWNPIFQRWVIPDLQDRAYAVSYNRPLITEAGTGQYSGPVRLCVRRRLCGDLLAGEAGIRRLLHLRCRHRPAGGRLPQELPVVHLGRP